MRGVLLTVITVEFLFTQRKQGLDSQQNENSVNHHGVPERCDKSFPKLQNCLISQAT